MSEGLLFRLKDEVNSVADAELQRISEQKAAERAKKEAEKKRKALEYQEKLEEKHKKELERRKQQQGRVSFGRARFFRETETSHTEGV